MCAVCRLHLELHELCLRPAALNDAAAYAKLVKAGLTFSDCIRHVQLPIMVDGRAEIKTWPMLLPHVLVRTSGDICTLCSHALSTQAGKLLSEGCSFVLGDADQYFWSRMSTMGVDKPGGNQKAVGIQFFGDEAEIWKSNQYCAMSWMSEHTPYYKNAALSRFLICLLPVNGYVMSPCGKVNLTLQEALRHVVASFNEWYDKGVSADGFSLFAAVTCLKGDWKWIVQSLCLWKTPSNEEFCYLCCATKGQLHPYTDVTSSASWRSSPSSSPFQTMPQLAQLRCFSLNIVAIDILHCFFLGIGRDLIASILVVCLRSRIFAGSNVSWQIS